MPHLGYEGEKRDMSSISKDLADERDYESKSRTLAAMQDILYR